MEMRKVTSFQTMQSLGNKEICILVVHDDPRYRDILAKVLRCCGRYKGIEVGITHKEDSVLKQTISDALSTIRERKDRLNLFVTDIDRSNPNGFVIWQYIEKEFKLDIRSIAPYEGTKLAIDLTSECNLHFLKSLSVNEFESLWQYACAEESGKATGGQEKPLWDENAVEVSLGNMSLFPEATQYDHKRKRRESQETTEKSYATSDGSAKAKKPRVIWNDWLHHKFVEAIKQLGVEPHKAMPKKIKDLMNVKNLSRESVASHLQKYRQTLLRAEKVMQSTGSFFGSNLTTHLKHNRFSSSRFAQNFNSSQGNTLYLNQQPNLIISHQPGSDYSSLLHPEASTSTSNMRHEHQFTGTYPFGHSFSPPDPIAQNDTNLFDFGTAQSYSQTGLAQLDSGCVPGINGQSSNAVGAYVGYRLAGNGLSVETGKVVVSGDDENGTDKVSLSAGGSWNESFEQISLSPGGSWNESLVQTTLASGDYIPQQQPSQPPVHAVAHDLDNLGAEDEVGRLLDTTGSTSSQFFWDDDFNDALFDNTD